MSIGDILLIRGRLAVVTKLLAGEYECRDSRGELHRVPYDTD